MQYLGFKLSMARKSKHEILSPIRQSLGLNAIKSRGHFVVQTLHPKTSCSKAPYEDGWREGSWVAFNDDFCNPHPWYFRRIESWNNLLYEANLTSIEITESVHPKTGALVSIIMIATLT